MHKFTPIIVALILLLTIAAPALAGEPPPAIYYAGPESSVKTALELAEFALVTNPADADAIVLNGVVPDPAAMAVHVETGTGLVLVLTA